MPSSPTSTPDVPQLAAESQSIRSAHDAALKAVAALHVGGDFLGAFGDADSAGYPKGHVDRPVFITTYLNALPRVWCDKFTGKISCIEPKPAPKTVAPAERDAARWLDMRAWVASDLPAPVRA